ncbi:haloacid dehalogenase-like hydrolase [Fodinibius saliphilus]|uniref:haloacid dehalogenase-like hydrolase n=1 Tax=Fodinibius saliphilus TaxID=1920650 RepID=UPI001107C363|nr:haloacid dehalogenase-like hydrolase [Fodinibius saliphilus]
MNDQLIVFDFDKTMTEKDTVLGFYKEASTVKLLYCLKLPLLYLFALLTKLNVITNTELKRLGIKLFLRGLKREKLEKVASDYSTKIKLNEVYRDDFGRYPPEKVVIMSASYQTYLKPLFPNHRVVGSELLFDSSSQVADLHINMYGEQKKKWLNNQGIDEIDILFTDSYSDKPLMDIAKNVVMVKNGEKELLKQNKDDLFYS